MRPRAVRNISRNTLFVRVTGSIQTTTYVYSRSLNCVLIEVVISLMRIYIIRHGDAVPEGADPARPLSEDGKQSVQKVAAALKNAGCCVNTIFHSTKLRAKETALIIRQAVNPQAVLKEKEHLSPNDVTDDIYEELLKISEDAMVVSHLPFVDNLASRLIYGSEDRHVLKFTAGTAAILQKDSRDKWKLVAAIIPEEL